MILIGVCVIPVELIMDNILAGMRRLGPLQCDCGLADISGPEIARLWWHTWTRSNIQRHMTSTSTSTSTNREGKETRMAHVRTRIFGFWFSVSVGLVIMKRKLRKLNKIQTNQCGIYLYMPISDIMQILSPHTHTYALAHAVKQMAGGIRNWLNCMLPKQTYVYIAFIFVYIAITRALSAFETTFCWSKRCKYYDFFFFIWFMRPTGEIIIMLDLNVVYVLPLGYLIDIVSIVISFQLFSGTILRA